MMKIHELLLMTLAVLVIAGASGCAATTRSAGTSSPALLEVQPDEYEAAFDAAIESLRREHFRLERIDRRLGVITTEPRTSGSIVEPWRPDNSTIAQALESTMHHQRRSVRVEFLPAGAEPPPSAVTQLDLDATDGDLEQAPDAGLAAVTPDPPPFEPINAMDPLTMSVKVIIERSHRPGRRVETVSLKHSGYSRDPQLAERGVPAAFWEPIGDDPHMEDRILDRIRSTLADSTDRQAVPVEATEGHVSREAGGSADELD